jgi:hypothetical protein
MRHFQNKTFEKDFMLLPQSSHLPTCPKAGTSENYERICLNKKKIFLNLAFGQVGEKN